MGKRGCRVWAFDFILSKDDVMSRKIVGAYGTPRKSHGGLRESESEEEPEPSYRFFSVGIGPYNSLPADSLEGPANRTHLLGRTKRHMQTLENIAERMGIVEIDVLRMDVEGAEWNMLDTWLNDENSGVELGCFGGKKKGLKHKRRRGNRRVCIKQLLMEVRFDPKRFKQRSFESMENLLAGVSHRMHLMFASPNMAALWCGPLFNNHEGRYIVDPLTNTSYHPPRAWEVGFTDLGVPVSRFYDGGYTRPLRAQ